MDGEGQMEGWMDRQHQINIPLAFGSGSGLKIQSAKLKIIFFIS